MTAVFSRKLTTWSCPTGGILIGVLSLGKNDAQMPGSALEAIFLAHFPELFLQYHRLESLLSQSYGCQTKRGEKVQGNPRLT